MRKTPNVIRVLVMIIGNYKQPIMSRWACYLTSVMISDSPKTMEAFSGGYLTNVQSISYLHLAANGLILEKTRVLILNQCTERFIK